MAEEPTIAASGAPVAPAGGGAAAPAVAGGGSGEGGVAPSQTPSSSTPAGTGGAGEVPVGGAASPPAGTLATGATNEGAPPSPTWPTDWRTQLAGDDKAYLKTLERFDSPTALAKSYREMQTKISSGQMRTPAPAADATPEVVATWRKENGIPDAPAGYVEKLALSNGMVPGEADKPIISSFAERAHSLTMPPEQFNGMVSQYYEMLDTQAQERQVADHSFKVQAQDTLNKEWGPEFRPNINAVSNLLASAPEGVKDRLFAGRTADGQVIGNDPQVLRWLAGLAREVNPLGTLMPAGTSDPMKSGEARIKEIEGLMRGPEAQTKYWKDSSVQEEYRNLLDAREKMTARGR